MTIWRLESGCLYSIPNSHERTTSANASASISISCSILWIGFSIPINTAKPIIEQVIKSGNFEKVTLGIKGIDVTTFESSTGTDLAADKGVYIVEVVSDTPAQKSGIQAGDVIVKVGNDETPTMTDLNKVLYKYKSGQSTKVTVNRSGKEVTVDIKF